MLFRWESDRIGFENRYPDLQEENSMSEVVVLLADEIAEQIVYQR